MLASPLFCDDLLHQLELQALVRDQPFESRVFLFQLAQALQVRHAHPAVLGTPRVERRRADPVLARDIRHAHAGLGLFQDPGDLTLAELRLAHGNLRLGTFPEIRGLTLRGKDRGAGLCFRLFQTGVCEPGTVFVLASDGRMDGQMQCPARGRALQGN